MALVRTLAFVLALCLLGGWIEAGKGPFIFLSVLTGLGCVQWSVTATRR